MEKERIVFIASSQKPKAGILYKYDLVEKATAHEQNHPKKVTLN